MSAGEIRSSEAVSAGWMLGLLQANDSFYPTGSYAHSFGLEGLIQDGVVTEIGSLRELVFASLVPSLRQNELPVAAHAWHALASENWVELKELCFVSAASKISREIRTAAENIGRQRLELCAKLYPSPRVQACVTRARAENWPVSSAVAAAVEGHAHAMPVAAVLASVYYAALVALMAAAMKLLRIGQNGSQQLLTEALAVGPATIAAALEVPVDEIGWYNPWLDVAAARHETADARLFIS